MDVLGGTKPSKWNSVWLGLAAGLLVPMAALTAYYFARFSGLNLADFIKVYRNLGILTHVISLAVIPNLLVFFGFIQKNYLLAARGVLAATFLFTLIVVIIRFT
ncbi:MAG: hypothetical protein R6V75_07445 [Bacteroidales bacterium]